MSGRLILQAVCEARPVGRVYYLPKRADILARLPELTRPGDLVITLGAGDVTSLPDEWLTAGQRGRARDDLLADAAARLTAALGRPGRARRALRLA